LGGGGLSVEFRILGSLEVLHAGTVIPLGGAKQRAALAILLLHPNEVVSRGRLIEGLWGESPPATAGHTLDTYMSRLRRALGSEGERPRVVGRRPGYSLRVEDGELDLQRFERLLEEGRHDLREGNNQRAADGLRQALNLFRGPPLDDLAHTNFAHSEAARLDELPLAALEERIEADLRLGRQDEVLPELQTLVVKHPFRERFWGELMLALYRSGRQAEALAAFERARHLLAEELGVDPGPSLQRVHEDILRQAASLDRVAPSHVRPSRPVDLGSGETVGLPGPIATTEREGSWIRPSPEPAAATRQTTSPHRRVRWPPLPHRGRVRAVLAALIAFAVIAVVVATSHDPPVAAPTAIEPGINLLDAATGEVVARFPSISAGEIWYADGVFWILTLQDGRSISFTGINARTRQVVPPFATGLDDVGDFAVHGDDLWVSDYTGPTLLRIDLPSGRIEDEISLAPRDSSDSTGSFQVVSGAGSIWVARPDTGEIVRIDARTGQIQNRYSNPAPGCCLAFGGGRLWFEREDGVTWLDPRTGQIGPLVQVIGSIAVGGGFGWSANMETGTASKISGTGKIVATYPTGEGAERISYDDGRVWVQNHDAGTVTAIDTVTGASRSYSMGHLVGPIAAGNGLVAVMVESQELYDDTIASLQGNVARIMLPAYFTVSQEPAVTDIESNPLMVQIEEATCAKLLNYPDEPARDGWRLKPEIATSMPTRSADGRTYTFTVGTGYRFSPPSNQPVTADAFRYSIERALSPGLGSETPGASVIPDMVGESAFRAGTAAHISGLRTVGDRLIVALKRPSADFLDRLALPYFCPVPIGTPIVPDGVQDVAPPSAGPYYMALPRETGELMILQRNPNYTGPRPHQFDAFAIREGIDPGEAVGRVQQGTWDAVSELNKWVTNFPFVEDPLFAPGGPLERASGSQAGDGPSYQSTTLPSVDYLAFNASRPLFSRRRIRTAVASALDRSALAAIRGETASGQLMPPTITDLDLSNQRRDRPAKPTLGRPDRLFGNAPRIAVMGVPDACEQCLQVAHAVKAQLRLAGLGVRIKLMDKASMEALAQAPVDLIERVTTLPYPDSATFMAKMLGGDVPVTWLPAHVRSKVEWVAALDGSRRSRSAVRLAQRLARRDTPVATFADGSIGELFSERIGCIQPLPFGSGVDLAALCVKNPGQTP
jgi:DNA-binding SARP family transcriptional activator/ABC-type transport system substrate-binding protein